MRLTLQWAFAHGYVDGNVAGEAIDGALPSMASRKKHYPALPFGRVPEALRLIEASGHGVAAKACLRFMVLTVVRGGEARGARWEEIDLDARTWNIPAERMKMKEPHRVPLSTAALDVLEQVRVLNDGSGLVFPSPDRQGRPLSDMTLGKVLKALGLRDGSAFGLEDGTVPHGFRAAFRNWCAETGKPREVAEAALAHAVPGVEGAYFTSDVFDRRTALMNQWAAFLTGERAKVVSIGAGR